MAAPVQKSGGRHVGSAATRSKTATDLFANSVTRTARERTTLMAEANTQTTTHFESGEMPKFEIPRFALPKFEVPKMEVPAAFREIAEKSVTQAKDNWEK